jgi:hypothetical protein
MRMSETGDWAAIIDKLVAATEDARDVIREAHGASRDLRQLIAEARRVIATDVETALKKQLVSSVTEALEQVGSATRDAMEDAVARVNAKFDELEEILTGADPRSRRQGKPSLEDLIRLAGPDARGAFAPAPEVPAAFQPRTHLHAKKAGS